MYFLFLIRKESNVDNNQEKNDNNENKPAITINVDKKCIPAYLIIGAATFLTGVICGWLTTRRAYMDSDGPEIDDSNINPEPEKTEEKSE